MKYLVIIDTNVLVSALLSSRKDSPVKIIINKIINGELISIYSKEIFEESREVLERQKFNFKLEAINIVLQIIKFYGIQILPNSLNIQLSDMKDLPFYEIVMDKKDSFLITGNLKHFPKMSRIMSPREFLDFINTNIYIYLSIKTLFYKQVFFSSNSSTDKYNTLNFNMNVFLSFETRNHQLLLITI